MINTCIKLLFSDFHCCLLVICGTIVKKLIEAMHFDHIYYCFVIVSPSSLSPSFTLYFLSVSMYYVCIDLSVCEWFTVVQRSVFNPVHLFFTKDEERKIDAKYCKFKTLEGVVCVCKLQIV